MAKIDPDSKEGRQRQAYNLLQAKLKRQKGQIADLLRINQSLRVRLALEINCDPDELVEFRP